MWHRNRNTKSVGGNEFVQKDGRHVESEVTMGYPGGETLETGR